MNESQRYSVSTVLITGASRGLGYELARQYAGDGWKVIGTVRSAEARAAVEKLGAETHTVDVTDRKSISRLAARLKGAPIDVLVCNAGIHGPKDVPLGRLDYSVWEEVLRVNVLGAAAVVEALVDNVAASDRRVIVLMSSRMGSIGESRGSEYLYPSSKAALNMLGKTLALDLAPRGVTVASISPGWVRTDMGGRGAPLAPETSISGVRKVIAGLSLEKSGRFFNHDGSAIAW